MDEVEKALGEISRLSKNKGYGSAIMTNYWIIGTGRGEDRDALWKDYSEENRVRINFSIKEDLGPYAERGYVSLKDFVDSERPKNSGSADQCWNFAAIIADGDIVIARQGVKRIVGLGRITSGYRFNPDLDWYMHIRDVEWGWIGDEPWTGQRFHTNTVVELTEDNGRFHGLIEFMDARLLVDFLEPGGITAYGLKDYNDAAQNDAADEEVEQGIKVRVDIDETEKDQLIRARRGQGKYRSNVASVETACRLTGVHQEEHLRASHIKPWRVSNDEQRLDGNNGLLLSPHVDHLFDRGWISFNDDGSLMIAPELEPEIWERWGLDFEPKTRSFNPAQQQYLAYHRDYVFRR
jgi:hypothetical protein